MSKMYLNAVVYVMSIILFSETECRLPRSKHFMHPRDYQTFQIANQTPPVTSRFQPVTSRPPSVNPNSGQIGFSPQSDKFSAFNFGSQSGNFPLSFGNAPMQSGFAPSPPESTSSLPPGSIIPSQPGSSPLQAENAPLQHDNYPLRPWSSVSQAANVPLQPGVGSFQPGNFELPPGNLGLTPGSAQLQPGNYASPPKSPGLPSRTDMLQTRSADLQSKNDELIFRAARFAVESTKLTSENHKLPLRSISPATSPETSSTTDFRSFLNENDFSDATLELTSSNSPLESVLASDSNADSNFSFNNANLKQQREDAPEKNSELEELFESGKEFLEESTENDILKENNYLKAVNDLEGDDSESNTTLIPIPKGLQIKTASKLNNKKVNATTNITSGTETLLSLDNATEIENVVEMQMEKEIEDDKGANRGSEEVRIVETEHVKPVANKKWNDLNLRKRRWKNYNKRFIMHHRDKRFIAHHNNKSSKIDFTKVPKLNSVFSKMVRRFFSNLERKERVADRSNALIHHVTPNVSGNHRRNIARQVKPATHQSRYDRDEMNDFLTFFLKQMQKFKKSREDNENRTLPFRRLNIDEYWNNAKLPVRKMKKLNENIVFPQHMNVFMNFNMTWDSKVKENPKSHTDNIMNLMTTMIPSTYTTHQRTETFAYVGERKDSGLLSTILQFSVLTLILMALICLVRDKIFKMCLNDMIYKTKDYKLCLVDQGDRMRGLKYIKINNACMEDYPQLEWQSEKGDWLSESETDFK